MKKLFLGSGFILISFFSYTHLASAAIDSTSTIGWYFGGSDTQTSSLTIGDHPDRKLVLSFTSVGSLGITPDFICGFGSASTTYADVTHNFVGDYFNIMTLVVMDAPDVGTHTLTCTTPTAAGDNLQYTAVSVVSLYNIASQLAPIGTGGFTSEHAYTVSGCSDAQPCAILDWTTSYSSAYDYAASSTLYSTSERYFMNDIVTPPGFHETGASGVYATTTTNGDKYFAYLGSMIYITLGFRETGSLIAQPSLSNLAQFKSDATTPIEEGATTAEDTVVFSALLTSSSTNPLRLEVEYMTSTFSGTPNASSSVVSPNSTATTTVSLLQDGSYRWRARAVDASTTAASNWIEFGTSGNIDFNIHQVPLYTQVQSDFPSLAQTQSWFELLYADGRGTTGPVDERCGTSIAQCGCAITSVVMIAKYHGVAEDADGNDFTPLNINNWLTANNGYDSHGKVIWPQVAKYAQDYTSGIGLYFPPDGFSGPDTSTLNAYLASLNPVILYNANVGHFLVAASKLVDTYAVRDPDFYLTRTLNDNVSNSSTTHDYNNQFSGLRLFSPTSTNNPALVQGIYINLGSPAELLITDPSGDRLGRNPVGSTTYNEIAGGVYDSEGISDGSEVNPSAPGVSKFAWIPNPEDGLYVIKVIGTSSGSYTLTTLSYDASSTPYHQTATGSITQNEIDTYALNFTTTTPEEISLVASTTLIATADSYLKEGHPNQNQGTENYLRIRDNGDNRSLLKFDPSSIPASSTILSATLNLTIADNSNNWGSSGRTVDIHRLTDNWTESGVTWNCGIDSDTSNQNDNDCNGTNWEMSQSASWPFVASGTDSFLVTNNASGTVAYDLTSDVQSFFRGTSNYGWLLKKTNEGQAGAVEFGSRETANKPTLVVNYRL